MDGLRRRSVHGSGYVLGITISRRVCSVCLHGAAALKDQNVYELEWSDRGILDGSGTWKVRACKSVTHTCSMRLS
jgi:hypothetical protein